MEMTTTRLFDDTVHALRILEYRYKALHCACSARELWMAGRLHPALSQIKLAISYIEQAKKLETRRETVH